jgi:hypothetical protein
MERRHGVHRQPSLDPAAFDRRLYIGRADVYLFRVSFGDVGANGSEYAAIAKSNGAFLRLEAYADGETRVLGGLGGFPKAE